MSILRIGAIASNTLTDLTRQRVFYFILVFALILIGSSVFMARFSFQQEFQILKDISLGAMSIFTSLLAILATARLLPQDIEDRTAYTILAKPVPRFEYLLGKLLGVLALLAIGILVMSALFCLVLYVRRTSAIQEVMRQMASAPYAEMQSATDAIRAATFNAGLFEAIVAIFMKAAVLSALTLFVTTFATTNIFTVFVMIVVYFIGHLQATAREYWLHQQGGRWLTHLFLAIVALVFPDLQTFNLVDNVVTGTPVVASVFLTTIGLGVFYVVVYTLLATVAFYGKEL